MRLHVCLLLPSKSTFNPYVPSMYFRLITCSIQHSQVVKNLKATSVTQRSSLAHFRPGFESIVLHVRDPLLPHYRTVTFCSRTVSELLPGLLPSSCLNHQRFFPSLQISLPLFLWTRWTFGALLDKSRFGTDTFILRHYNLVS